MVNPEHDGRLQYAERAIHDAMADVTVDHDLTAMEWAAVFTQCLLGVVVEALEGCLTESEGDDAFSDPSTPW